MPRAVSAIGIDLGRHAIKAVQCAGSRAAPRIVASVTLARTDQSPVPTPDECARLGEVLWRHGFQGRRTVVTVPESCLMASVVEVPPSTGGAPVREIAAAELARLHAVDPETLHGDCWTLAPAGPKGQRHEAVAVAVRTADAGAVLESLQSRLGAGLEVLAIDVGLCARARAALLDAPDEPSWGVLDLGWTGSRLSVVQGRTIVYERALPDFGLAHLDARLERECSLNPDDIRHVLGRTPGSPARRISSAWTGVVSSFGAALATEVRESVRYLALHRAIPATRTIRLTGGGAECQPLVQALDQELDHASPLSIARCFAGRSAEAPDRAHAGLTAALGLCLRAA